MNEVEVRALAESGTWNGEPLVGSVIDTHISWVILTARLAFKIKKPVRFSFLDFSTLERRKHFCHREVELNRRLADIYLDVVPIRRRDGVFILGGEGATPVDYAVRIRKVDPGLEMGRVLADGRVSRSQIEELADIVAAFHTRATIVRRPFDEHEMKRTFNDLRTVAAPVGQRLGADYAAICESAIGYGNRFLDRHRPLLAERAANGFRRDVHGDFHTGNVFLSTPPVIFDCIEFNDAMREIDILDEVAFLCMDLEVAGRRDLGDQFMETYIRRMKLPVSDEEWALFSYYRIYRAGVRAKVAALRDGDERDWRETARYLDYIRTQLTGPGGEPATRR